MLLEILRGNGIRDQVLSWFTSYLTGRQQLVCINGCKSKETVLNCGVPQGSILGPILFTLYTSSLGHVLRKRNSNYHFYADDSQLYVSFKPKSPLEIQNASVVMESCIDAVRQWMNFHRLKMNNTKTEVLLISSIRRSIPNPLPLRMGDSVVRVVHEARNIGVIFDSYLKMDKQVGNICKRCFCHLRNLSRLRPYLRQSALEQLVHCFISSLLDCNNALLLGTTDSNLSKLQKVQNAAARIITGTRKREHITPVLKRLHWLPVRQRIEFKILLLVFKCIQGLAPAYLCELVSYNIADRTLRSNDQLQLEIPFTRSAMLYERSFSVAGPRLWNALPQEVRLSTTVCSFKSKLKTQLFKAAYVF